MNKVMSTDNLNDIIHRLSGCHALVNALYEIAGVTTISEDALSGVLDLLDGIRRDFRADIDSAEDYAGKEAGAV